MKEIEIGKNEKGELAVLKIIYPEPTHSEDEIIGLEGNYTTIVTIPVHSNCKVYCGKIDREYLLRILSEQKPNIEKIEKLI